MMTVDDLLLKLVNFKSPTIEEAVPGKDSRVLRSLANAVNTHYFITENQSRLLMKILRENQKNLGFLGDDLTAVLNLPTWSKKFRKIDQVKKLFISEIAEGELALHVEFTFNSQIRKNLQNLSKKIEGLVQLTPGKLYIADLTEKNIVTLVEALTPMQFTIDEIVKTHYDTIKSWSEEEVRSQFMIENMVNQNFQKTITADLGLTTELDKSIIYDRSIRYQFFSENREKFENLLVDTIANRDGTRVWVDSNTYTLSQVIDTLMHLRRLPVLIIFPAWDSEKLVETMENLSKSFEANGIEKDVGIYFRLPSDADGKVFNQLIAEKKYNTLLDSNTKIAGIQTGKIPKFMIKSGWTPMSVISLDNNLRYNKASVYANCCDLIVTYSHVPSLIEQRTL